MTDDSFRQLHRFVCQVDRSPTLQDMVVECRSPEEIIAIAEKLGCTFSRDRLRKESRWLSAPYWPWVEKGRLMRVAFFSKDWARQREGEGLLRSRHLWVIREILGMQQPGED